MNSSNRNFIFLFIKIVIPIIITLLIGSIYLFEQASIEKKDFMFEKVATLSKMISNMIIYEKEYNSNYQGATLEQIQSAFRSFKDSSDIKFEYLVAKKNDKAIEFIAFSSLVKPKSVKISDTHVAVPMKRALEGLSGVEVEYDYNDKKVFSAYTPIENRPWGLVIKQPYSVHIAPFKKVTNTILLSIIVVIIVLFFTLKFYEYKRSELLRLKEEEIIKLAYFDTLTGVANRKNISDKIESEIKTSLRYKTNSALIFIDLDGFKLINDSLGHGHGDKVLQIIAKRLEESIRDCDEVGRVGGDEFILLIRGDEKNIKLYKEYLLSLTTRVIKSVNKPLNIDNSINYVGASLGVAIIPKDGENSIEIIKNADSAMYKAKKSGKNCAIFYDSTI